MLAGTERSPSEAAADESSKNGAAAEPARAFAAHVADIAAHVSRLARVRAARLSVRVSRTVFLALGGVVLATLCTAAGLAGVRLAVRGLTGALTAALDGRAWLAELSSGLVVLAGTALVVLAVQTWIERRILRSLRKRPGGTDAGP